MRLSNYLVFYLLTKTVIQLGIVFVVEGYFLFSFHWGEMAVKYVIFISFVGEMNTAVTGPYLLNMERQILNFISVNHLTNSVEHPFGCRPPPI